MTQRTPRALVLSFLCAPVLALLAAGASPVEAGRIARPRLGEAETAAYIIGKILDNFDYRGRTVLATWTVEKPVIAYRRPYFDISFLKHVYPNAAPPEDYGMRFRIDVQRARSIAIETGVLRVACFANCVEVESNGKTGRFPYFWINAVAVDNPVDARRLNRAFARLLKLAGVAREPFD